MAFGFLSPFWLVLYAYLKLLGSFPKAEFLSFGKDVFFLMEDWRDVQNLFLKIKASYYEIDSPGLCVKLEAERFSVVHYYLSVNMGIVWLILFLFVFFP